MPVSAPRLQRGHGRVEITWTTGPRGQRLARLYASDPCRVLFPRPGAGEPETAVLLTTSGGLAGGDTLDVRIEAGDGTAVLATAQAAEKVYRSLGTDTRVDVRLAAGDGAWLEWLPQEAILFDGARLRRRLEVELAPTARLLALEIAVLGRRARGERFGRGLFREDWRIRRAGRLAWADAFRLDGDVSAAVAAPAGLDGAGALATLVYAGPDAPARLGAAREALEGGQARSGASVVGGVLVARFLHADAAVLRREAARLWCGLRAEAGGRPPAMPRLWNV